MAVTVVVAYDVCEDRRRARLAALLQAYGDRVQKSVFVLTLDDSTLHDITARAATLIDLDDDSMYVYRAVPNLLVHRRPTRTGVPAHPRTVLGRLVTTFRGVPAYQVRVPIVCTPVDLRKQASRTPDSGRRRRRVADGVQRPRVIPGHSPADRGRVPRAPERSMGRALTCGFVLM